QAPVAHPQWGAETGAKSPADRSRRRWLVCVPGATEPAGPFRDCLEARHTLAPASSAQDSEIPPAVLLHNTEEAGPERAEPRRGDRRRRHETAESNVGVSTNRAADRLGLRYSHQQGCGAAHPRREVQAGARLGGAVLAHGARSREGQSVEPRL